jgi:transposase
VTETTGVVLAVMVTAANVHDSRPAMPLLDRVPPLPVGQEKPRRRVRVVLGDKAYGTPANRAGCRRRRVTSLLARVGEPVIRGLGAVRYVVERTLSWFNNYRRLRMCYERNGDHLQALHDLAAALMCAKRLAPAP